MASKAWMIVYSRSQVWIARPSHLFEKKLTLPTTTMPWKHAHKRTRCNPDPERHRLRQAQPGRDTIGAQSSVRGRTPCHLSPIALSQRLFFHPHPDVLQLLDESKHGGCIFFFILAQMQAADPDRNSKRMHGIEDERRRAEIPQMSRVQILSCEHSYNIKAWCSCCLPLVGSPLPGRFVHFWVLLLLLQTHAHARKPSRTHTPADVPTI